jgi:hypothetical protein
MATAMDALLKKVRRGKYGSEDLTPEERALLSDMLEEIEHDPECEEARQVAALTLRAALEARAPRGR